MNETKNSMLSGFGSGLLGSLCCVAPLVLVLLGLSGVTGAMALVGTLQQNYRWTLFIPMAALFLIGSIYFHIKRKEGVCNTKTIKKYKLYIIMTVGFAVVVWIALLYAIVPLAFKLLS